MAKFPPAPVRTPIAGPRQDAGNGSESPPYAWERWFQSLTDFNSNPRIPQATPASSSARGVAGSLTYDANFLYGCVATNQWKKIAWSSF